MSPRLRPVSSRELIAVLEKLGFERRSLGGTGHARFVHVDGRKTTVPIHGSRDIGRGLLRKILRDVELTVDEFLKML